MSISEPLSGILPEEFQTTSEKVQSDAYILGQTIVTVPTKLGKRLFITDQLELRLRAPGVKHCFDQKINLLA